jgi:hypothetical protein
MMDADNINSNNGNLWAAGIGNEDDKAAGGFTVRRQADQMGRSMRMFSYEHMLLRPSSTVARALCCVFVVVATSTSYLSRPLILNVHVVFDKKNS